MRLTRGFFKRKLFVFGLSLFSSVALISTGFAVWAMSRDANSEENGNVGVGLIVEGQLKIENLTLSDDVIMFEPTEDDTSGRVRNDGESFESLSITVTAKVSPVSYLGSLKVFLCVPQGVLDAIEEGYISCNTILSDAIILDGSDLTSGGYSITLLDSEKLLDTYTLNVTLEFGWGSKFGNMNPGLYYDADPSGILVSDNDVVTELENFRATLYSYISEFNEDGSNRAEVINNHQNDILDFTVYVSATVN